MITFVFDTPEENSKFTYLYEAYGKYIYCTFKRLRLDDYTIQDLSHDVYIILAHHINDIDIKNHKATQNYIITIAKHYGLNFLRRQKHSREDLVDEIPSAYHDKFDDTPLEKLLQKEQLEMLFTAVHELDWIYRSVLELKYVNNMKNGEIASVLKIKKKTVEMRLYRANILLRSKLKESDYE
ncbi:MAG: sigma-70 family RNA polymerase sigma factor [Eubacteriales bacterium]|nr:sigma-70 family RNA polymerase sigma factor [Eubacteriales bacterium]